MECCEIFIRVVEPAVSFTTEFDLSLGISEIPDHAEIVSEVKYCVVDILGRIWNVGHSTEQQEYAPQDISALLNAPDEHPMVAGISQGRYQLQQTRTTFSACPGRRVSYSGDSSVLKGLIRFMFRAPALWAPGLTQLGVVLAGNKKETSNQRSKGSCTSCTPNCPRLSSISITTPAMLLLPDRTKT